MHNIVYLFGAGASCNVLPVVGEITLKIKEFIKFLHSVNFDEHYEEKQYRLKNQLIVDWSQNVSSSYAL